MIVAHCLFQGAGPACVARVMDIRGDAQIQSAEGPPRAAAPFDPLTRGDRLTVPAGGCVTLLFFETGAKERVKASTKVKIGLAGCEPPEAVERVKPVSRSVATTLRDLRSRSGQEFATNTLRGMNDRREAAPPAITPVDDSTVISDQPNLEWKGRPDVKTYRVELRVRGSDRFLWLAQTSEPRLAFPPGQPSLRRARGYFWQVSDQEGRSVCSGRFTVATGTEAKQLAEFDALAKSDDPADLLAAGVVFTAHGVDDQAIKVYERLAELAPTEALYHELLAGLYHRAGRPTDAKRAAEAAKSNQRASPSRPAR